MRVDSPCVERIIHFGVPRTIEIFFVKVEGLVTSGRDGRPELATMYYNNNDLTNLEGMQPIMREYSHIPSNSCGRKSSLNTGKSNKHSCCDVCRIIIVSALNVSSCKKS